jgi:hypothetical protein
MLILQVVQFVFWADRTPDLVIWLAILGSVAFCVWQLCQALRTEVVAFPLFVWFWNIDREKSHFLYRWAVACYGAGLVASVVMSAMLLAGSYAEASDVHSDYLQACIASSGKEYDIDANTSRCPPGDVSYRCLMPSGKLFYTRGADACRQKGGYPMGTKPVPAWLSQPKNSN